MAIAFARARYISRSTGGVATRSASYNAREAITDIRTGERYSFAHRDAPEYHAVLLPEGADAGLLGTSAQLWNVAEGAERRRDAQVAREIVLALPANAELSAEDRIALARSFAEAHFVSRGLAAQLDVHAPHYVESHASHDVEAGGGEGGVEGANERANHHAHLLITTRRVEGDRLAPKKARDLDPEVRSFKGRAAVTDGERWGVLWAAHQDAYFAERGIEVRVEATAAVPGRHIGPVRMRAEDSVAVARAEEIARENAAAARDPRMVLGVLTRGNATFTMRDLDRHLARHIHDEAEHLDVKARVLGASETLALHDPVTGRATGRYTTREVREQERAALGDGARVAAGKHRALSAAALDAAHAGRSLREDQRLALEHAAGAGGLKILEGRAGTGKSYTLAAVRDAHARAGYEVVGLGPTNGVARDLKADGFARAATAHSELFRLRNGRSQWTSRTLVVVDEAAMMDARITGELLAEARRSGAKLILTGDDRQLASIERGGLFAELIKAHGSVEITQVTRQRVDWQRRAARDLAEGRVEAAVRAFAKHGALDWSGNAEAARARLVARWTADTAADLGADRQATRFVFAYTNAEVDALNAELREVRRARGELGAEARFETKHGEAEFAVGDRIQFTETDRRAGLANGEAGVITAIDAETGKLTARLDAGVGAGREVSWFTSEFEGFRHGYAGTIYKGQGKTLDHTYLLHSQHWRKAASYVALTRQRQSAMIFAATDTARDLGQLARQMARGEVRAASVAWATRDELPAELRKVAGESVAPRLAAKRDAAKRATAPEPVPKREEQGARQIEPSSATAAAHSASQEPGWLIAPADSGPPLERGTIAAAVAASPEVQRERAALGLYLEGAYRDPGTARARLDELVKSHGATSAARRVAGDPKQLGELRGRTGLLVGPAARRARAEAERVATAVAPAVARIGAAEARAAAEHRARDAALRAAAATGVPRLSEAARTALGVAGDVVGRAGAWEVLRADVRVAGEIDRFLAAVEGRFGAEGLRAFERGSVPERTKVPPAERAALVEVGRALKALRGAERAAMGQARRVSATQRAGQGPRLKP